MSTYKTTNNHSPLRSNGNSKTSGGPVANTKPKTGNSQNIRVNESNKNLEDSTENMSSKTNECDNNVDLVISVKDLQCDKDIADYLAYLNKPINVNDHYIKLCQYHCEFGYFGGKRVFKTDAITSSARRRNNHDNKKVEIVEYSELREIKDKLLEREQLDSNCNIKEVPESVLEPRDEFDRHRPLTQCHTKVDLNRNEDSSKDLQRRIRRSQTFSVGPRRKEEGLLLKQFFSFRETNKNKNGRRRKRISLGDEEEKGQVWPIVCKFNKSISSGSVVSKV